jgi:ethanolamine utilization cobalamin adenosyltransferase
VIVTESALREQLRRPSTGARVRVPAGATLSPAAADFVAQWRLVLDEGPPGQVPDVRADPGTWDRPSTFPVERGGDIPRCTTCGSEVTEKPDAMTQLNACHFALKTAPRIRLRGRIDSLQAQALLAGAQAGAQGCPALASHLGTVAAYCRELLSAEYNERPAAAPSVDGKDEEAVHRATHDPRTALDIDHLTPSVTDPEMLHRLNVLRCDVREVEVVALEVFESPHHPFGASIVHGLNRLSSIVYYLELRLVREGGAW